MNLTKPFILNKFNLLVVEMERKVEGFDLSLLKNVKHYFWHNAMTLQQGTLWMKLKFLFKGCITL